MQKINSESTQDYFIDRKSIFLRSGTNNGSANGKFWVEAINGIEYEQIIVEQSNFFKHG